MQIRCRICNAVVPPDAIHMASGKARCRACGVLFAMGTGDTGGKRRLRRDRPYVIPPLNMRLTDHGTSFEITRRWSPIPGILSFMFAFALAVVALNVAMKRANLWGPVGIVFAIAILLLLYNGLAYILNTTTIRADANQLRIRHGPVPCFGGRTLQTVEIDQIYCVERQYKRKRRVEYSYEVRAILKNGREKTLLRGLESDDQALYIEQELENRLLIEDYWVAGSHR